MSALFDDLCEGLQEAIDYEKGISNILLSPVVQSEDVFSKYQSAMPFYQNILSEGVRYA